MVTISGKSLVPVNFEALGKFFNVLVPPEKLASFNVKLDGREKVKSVFAKLDEKELTVYTGGIVNCMGDKFPECTSFQSLILLFILYGIKQASMGQVFEVKTTDSSISAIRADEQFSQTMTQLPLFERKLMQLYPDAFTASVEDVKAAPIVSGSIKPVAGEKEKPKKAAKKKVTEGIKTAPLDNTPKIEVPADLNLMEV